VLTATHQAGHAPNSQTDSSDGALFREALFDVAIVRDGQGATKFITL
jgi:N-acetylglutamate synthase/N-acetylornithine aminotransferase